MNSLRQGRRLALLVAVGLLAVSLLLLAWPRFLASVRYLPVEHALGRYYADDVIPSDRLKVLIRFTEEAIGWQDHYRFHDGLSQLHYLRGLDVQTPAAERRAAYRAAADEAAAALQRAPAQPAAWLRLATLRWILHDEPDTIVDAWKMSVFTGRTHSALYAHRVELGLAQRAWLDDEGVAMLRDQLLLAWRVRPGTLVQTLARRDPELRTTGGLLAATDPVALQEMEGWLERLR